MYNHVILLQITSRKERKKEREATFWVRRDIVGGKCFQADPSECVMEEVIRMKEHEGGSERAQKETVEHSTQV